MTGLMTIWFSTSGRCGKNDGFSGSGQCVENDEFGSFSHCGENEMYSVVTVKKMKG